MVSKITKITKGAAKKSTNKKVDLNKPSSGELVQLRQQARVVLLQPHNLSLV